MNSFQCIMCSTVVMVSGPKTDVWVRSIDKGWQIICDNCATALRTSGYPCVKITFGLLKEVRGESIN